MNTDLRKKGKINFEKKLMNNAAFVKTMENLRKIGILNLSQQKEEETIWCQNQIMIVQSFLQNIF